MDAILSTAAHKPAVPLTLDHLVVAARTLDEGAAWLQVPTAMSRGELHWQITIPPGQLAGDGLLPTIIDWGDTRHPCTRLADSGVALAAMHLRGPAEAMAAFPRPAQQGRIQTTLAIGSRPELRAEFVVDGATIIIESCLPLRNLASFA